MMKHIRRRKLQASHQSRSYSTYKIVPSLHLAGVWLEESGFKAGDQVEITVKANELIIKPVQL